MPKPGTASLASASLLILQRRAHSQKTVELLCNARYRGTASLLFELEIFPNKDRARASARPSLRSGLSPESRAASRAIYRPKSGGNSRLLAGSWLQNSKAPINRFPKDQLCQTEGKNTPCV